MTGNPYGNYIFQSYEEAVKYQSGELLVIGTSDKVMNAFLFIFFAFNWCKVEKIMVLAVAQFNS